MSFTSSSCMKHLIIDVDAGHDDVQALMISFMSSDFIIDAITTVEGNTTLNHVVNNVLRILNLCKKKNIPVFKGCGSSILGKKSPNSGFHGYDGLGDVPELYPPDNSALQNKHAVMAMIDLVNQHSGEISLIALGPLTNIAMALRLDPEFCKKLKSFYIMGGNIHAKGNISICNEFNFHCDPEAAYIVFKSSGIIPYIVPLETCIDYQIPFDKYEELRLLDTPRARFILDTEDKLIKNMKASGAEGYITYDQCAMAALIYTNIVKSVEKYYISVELKGHYTRGQMIVDWKNHLGKEPNALIIQSIDQDKYLEIIRNMFLHID